MKTTTVYVVEQECAVPERGMVLRDQIVSRPALARANQEPVRFRRIACWNPDKQEILVFFTNLLHLSAAAVAASNKNRWAVELFLKAPKQTLKVKKFLGTSANAVKRQIGTALIDLLILKYLQMNSTFGWSLSNLATLPQQKTVHLRRFMVLVESFPGRTAGGAATLRAVTPAGNVAGGAWTAALGSSRQPQNKSSFADSKSDRRA